MFSFQLLLNHAHLTERLSSLLMIQPLLIFFFSVFLKMVRTTSEGMGYRFSETDWRISTVGASNIVTRLASRTVTGHELPIHVHQHYALEFHFVLNPNTKNNGSVETCMRRGFSFPWDARWWTKYDQRKEKQSDICCCRQIDDHCETMMCKTMVE